ncbi:MAG: hypothetical protein ACRDNF_07885, partial [Streptosporangiaceae bacterium]
MAGVPARALRPLVAARTWLAFSHLLAGTLTGAAAFVVIMLCTTFGLATLWFFLLGLQVLVAMMWLSLRFAEVERAR